MSLYLNIKGIVKNLFQIGGPASGITLGNNSGALEVKDTSNTNLIVTRVGRAAGNTDATTYLDVKERNVLIEFGIDGRTPPAAGANTGKYGFCHTAGGVYVAGAVYYDNGVALVAATLYKMQNITTNASAITGTVSLVANANYIAESGSAPYSWTPKGDGTGGVLGLERTIAVTFGYANATYDSTSIIPQHAVVTSVVTNVTSAFDSGTTIGITVNGSAPLTIQATDENIPIIADKYQSPVYTSVSATNTGVVRVSITGAGSVGAGVAYISYIQDLLA